MKKPSLFRDIAGDVVEFTIAFPLVVIVAIIGLGEWLEEVTRGSKFAIAICNTAERLGAKVRG